MRASRPARDAARPVAVTTVSSNASCRPRKARPPCSPDPRSSRRPQVPASIALGSTHERRDVPSRKAVIDSVFDGFRRSDHQQILSCLTEDVVWDLPGFKHLQGKDAFDREIENENFLGSPILSVDRLIEEANVVVATGQGTSTQTSGDLFEFALLRRLHVPRGTDPARGVVRRSADGPTADLTPRDPVLGGAASVAARLLGFSRLPRRR